MDRNTYAIGILSVTAVVLLVGIAVVGSMPRPALATGQMDRGGDYIMVTNQFNTGTELVFVIDAAMNRMAAYGYDINQKVIRPWDSFDFARIPGMGRPPGAGRP